MQKAPNDEFVSNDPNENPHLNESNKSSVDRQNEHCVPKVDRNGSQDILHEDPDEKHHYHDDFSSRNASEPVAQNESLKEPSQRSDGGSSVLMGKFRSQKAFNNQQPSPIEPGNSSQERQAQLEAFLRSGSFNSFLQSLKPSAKSIRESSQPNGRAENKGAVSPGNFIDMELGSSPENHEAPAENRPKIPLEQEIASQDEVFLPASELDEARKLNVIPREPEHEENESESSEEPEEPKPKLQLFQKNKLVQPPNDTGSKPKFSAFDAIRKKVESKQLLSPLKNKEPKPSPEKNPTPRRVEETKHEPDSAQSDPKFHGKYSVLEDLKLIDYVKSKPYDNPTSRTFWQKAYDRDKILNQKRTPDSLRERYRMQLRLLTEEDIAKMRKWVEEHKERGYITLKNVPVLGPSGNYVHVKKFDKVVVENDNIIPGTTLHKSPGWRDDQPLKLRWPSKTPEDGNKKKVEIPKNQNGRQNDQGFNQRVESRDQRRFQKGAANLHLLDSDSSDDIVEESRDRDSFAKNFKKRSPESLKVPETSRYVDQRKETTTLPKRKEYNSMHEISEAAMPRKTHYESSKPREENRKMHEEYHVEGSLEDWIEKQAERYYMSTNDMIELFYNCSMNPTTLMRYLQGETDLAWNEDEDILLRGPQKETIKRVLMRYKGVENVKEREEFLDKVETFTAVLHQKGPRQERSPLYQNPRQDKPPSKKKVIDFL